MQGTKLLLFAGCAAVAVLASGCADQGGSPVEPQAQAAGAAPLLASAPTQNDKIWWARLTAAQRGQLIVGKAKADIGNTRFPQRCNCKEAVRSWVLSASRNVVYIPSTKANNYQWDYSPVVSVVTSSVTARGSNGASTLSRMIPGDMIQMSLPGSPWLHTLIVQSVSGNAITAVEANYKSCQVTGGRTITFADLLNTRKVANFTVYRAISNIA